MQTEALGFSQERISAKTTKVERYGWTVIDGPGRYMALPKTSLMVDDSYQRTALEKKILKIAAEWSWIACGSISVGSRGDRYYVIDGQYRTLAAQRRHDITALPCIVFATTDAKQEAAGFLAVNTNRKPISSVDRHRALLIVGDAAAQHVDRLVQQSGRIIASDSRPTTVACVTALRRMVSTDGVMLDRIWPIIVSISEGNTLHERLVDGIFYLESHLPDGVSLTSGKWRSRLLKIGHDELMAGINKATAFYSRGGAKVFAAGIAEKLNHGLRDRIEMVD